MDAVRLPPVARDRPRGDFPGWNSLQFTYVHIDGSVSRAPDARRLPKVLFVIGSLDHGGSEQQLVALLERGHGEHFDAALATLRPAGDSELPERVARLGVSHTVLAGSGARPVVLARCLAGLARLVRSFRPDLVYAWLEESAFVSAPVARTARRPLIVARRNISGVYAGLPRPVVALMRAAERDAAVVTANSAAVAEEARRRGIRPERLRLVHNGHAEGDAVPLRTAPLVRLGYVARLRGEKGHRRLLAALAEVDADAEWRVDLAGDGPMLDELRAAAEASGLGDRVAFLGAVADVRAFWAEHDVAVLLSDHEGSPNALIEAAIAGRPMVATDVGGTRDIVVDGQTGVLVPLEPPAAIARALERLIDDPPLRERLGAAANALGRERFSMDAFVRGQVAAMRDALA